MTAHRAFPRHSEHERWLLTAAQRNDRRAQEELVRRYEPLVRAAVRTFTNQPAAGEREEFAQTARYGLWCAIRTWQPRRGSFRAYANACVRNTVANEINAAGADHRKTLTNVLSIDQPPHQSSTPNAG